MFATLRLFYEKWIRASGYWYEKFRHIVGYGMVGKSVVNLFGTHFWIFLNLFPPVFFNKIAGNGHFYSGRHNINHHTITWLLMSPVILVFYLYLSTYWENVWYGMVKKSRECFWCSRGHGVEFFSFRSHLCFYFFFHISYFSIYRLKNNEKILINFRKRCQGECW